MPSSHIPSEEGEEDEGGDQEEVERIDISEGMEDPCLSTYPCIPCIASIQISL